VAQLKAPPGVAALLKEADHPVMVRLPYGRGNVTLLAFDVEKDPFASWKGAQDFWKVTLTRLAPQVLTQRDVERGIPGRPGQAGTDLTTRLQLELDKFDTPP